MRHFSQHFFYYIFLLFARSHTLVCSPSLCELHSNCRFDHNIACSDIAVYSIHAFNSRSHPPFSLQCNASSLFPMHSSVRSFAFPAHSGVHFSPHSYFFPSFSSSTLFRFVCSIGIGTFFHKPQQTDRWLEFRCYSECLNPNENHCKNGNKIYTICEKFSIHQMLNESGASRLGQWVRMRMNEQKKMASDRMNARQ